MELTKLQEAWLHDLEHTRAKQGKGVLRARKDDGGGYCCLGRACVVAGVKGRHVTFGWIYGADAVECAPEEVVSALHLRDDAGEWNNAYEVLTADEKDRWDGSQSLAGLNDGGFTFKEIAAIIRRTPEAFFTNHGGE